MITSNRSSLPRALTILAVLLSTLAAACGGQGSPAAVPDVEVRPFSEVQASPFTFENDPAVPGRGVFRVVTSELMICAIVWGETEDLGRFNNSLAMSGTGITQHDVLLPDAQPGRTYYFVVQGSTADGTLYASPLSTFTLPARDDSSAEPGEDPRPNLALGATVIEASSEFGPAWAAENAVDGDLSTEWSTSGDGDDGFITIDLGQAAEITGIAFLTRTMADGSATTETFWIVVDGESRLGPFEAGTPADLKLQQVSLQGQTLRFEIDTSTGGNTGAVEIRVLGSTG